MENNKLLVKLKAAYVKGLEDAKNAKEGEVVDEFKHKVTIIDAVLRAYEGDVSSINSEIANAEKFSAEIGKLLEAQKKLKEQMQEES